MRAYGVKLRIIAIFGVDNLLASELLWNAVPAKSKGYSAWLKSISYSISYSIFGGNRSSTRFLPGKIVLLLDFFYSFTEKRNRSFTRSPTPIFHFVKSIFTVWHSHTQGSLVPRPRPSTRETGSGDFSRFSWHFVRFKSCDTCLCACAFQQQARDPRTAHCVVPRGRGLGSRHT